MKALNRLFIIVILAFVFTGCKQKHSNDLVYERDSYIESFVRIEDFVTETAIVQEHLEQPFYKIDILIANPDIEASSRTNTNRFQELCATYSDIGFSKSLYYDVAKYKVVVAVANQINNFRSFLIDGESSQGESIDDQIRITAFDIYPYVKNGYSMCDYGSDDNATSVFFDIYCGKHVSWPMPEYPVDTRLSDFHDLGLTLPELSGSGTRTLCSLFLPVNRFKGKKICVEINKMNKTITLPL